MPGPSADDEQRQRNPCPARSERIADPRGQALVVGDGIRFRRADDQNQASRERQHDDARDPAAAREHLECGTSCDPRGQPCDPHPRERLRVRPRQLFERQGAVDAGTGGGEAGAAEQVQPPHSGCDREDRDDRDGGNVAEAQGMKRRLALAAVALAVLGGGWYGAWSYAHDYYVYRGFPRFSEPAGIPRGRVLALRIWSPGLHARRKVFVYLPPGYFRGTRLGRRYPVLYLLQASVGQAANYLQVGGLNVRMDTLIHAHRVRPYIVVMPGGHGPDHEWANADAGRFESYVLDVVKAIDGRFSTIASRRGRAIAGLSEGGYGAINIALRHLNVFSVFESWSGYYTQTSAFPFSGLSAATIAANSPTAYVPSLRRQLHRLPVYAFLYKGNHEGFPPSLTVAFGRELRAAGAHVTWAIYPGRHNWALWRAHFTHMLLFAGRSFGR